MALYLITDRTQKDVDWLESMHEKKWTGMTQAQRTQWLGSGSTDLTDQSGQGLTDRVGKALLTGGSVVKGAYNYEDLLRVSCAFQLLAEELNELGYPVSVNVKLDWDLWDIPTASAMRRYLDNLNALRNAVGLFKTITTTPPSSMERFTFDGANRMERLLQEMEAWILGVQSSRRYAGEASCGES